MTNPADQPRAERDLLRAESISKHYGGVYALREADIEVRAGEVHALLGENGAGKSTLVKVLTGVHRPDHGRVLVEGEAVDIHSPLHAEQLGIHAIHQHLALVRGLSIVDNFLLGRAESAEHIGRLGFLNRRAAGAVVEEALEGMGLSIDPTTKIVDLSLPQAQLVQIARALTAQAKVLVLDEPTAALTPADRDQLFERLNALRDSGVGLVYISHRLDEITTLCDRATVLRDGRIVRTMEKEDLSVDAMISAMLDRPVQQLYPVREVAPTTEPVLEVEELKVDSSPAVTFSVNAGEIVGLTGLVGAGMVRVAEAVAGARRPESGVVKVDGTPGLPRRPLEGMQHGIALVPSDRAQALVAGLSLIDNLAITHSSKAQLDSGGRRRFRWMSPHKTRSKAIGMIERFGIEPRRPQAAAGSLSGGNQQKVVLAKATAMEPRVLILIEPTAGVDVGSRSQIYGVLRSIAASGVAVLLVSSDMQEVCGLSDRVCVFRSGAIAQELVGETNEREIMQHATALLVQSA